MEQMPLKIKDYTMNNYYLISNIIANEEKYPITVVFLYLPRDEAI